jgi:hypothetical protein
MMTEGQRTQQCIQAALHAVTTALIIIKDAHTHVVTHTHTPHTPCQLLAAIDAAMYVVMQQLAALA